MVGTSAFMPAKNSKATLDLNSDINCEDSEAMLDFDEENGRTVLLNNSKSIQHNSKTWGHQLFRCVCVLAICVLFVLSLLILTCAVRRTLSVSSSKPSWISNSDTNVLVYDGQEKFITWPDPPPHDDLAAVARYVMHISEWGSLATNSTHKGIEGYPFVNVFSVSDGPIKNSTGVPYFYLTPLELSVIDMKLNNKVSFTVSEAQSDYCNKNNFDPEDPRCAHVILTGSMKKLEKGSDEEKFAKDSLFSRHEEMHYWPSEHDWFFAKLDIVHIYVLDYFGGVGIVAPEEYFAKNPFLEIAMK